MADLDVDRLRELAAAATPGPWCYESCGEKGDGANIIGVAYGPNDEECERPLSGRLPEWNESGEEIEYYRDERVAICEHSDRNAGRNAEFIAAANPIAILALIAAYEQARRERDERAGWLAQMVIDKLGGTHDLPAWVYRSADYYAEAIKRADRAEQARDDAIEECAKVCDNIGREWNAREWLTRCVDEECAAAIRAMKGKS